MTDALMDRIKAHRSAPDVYDPPTFDQMADRIEQLEKERDELGRKLNMTRYGQPDFAWSMRMAAIAREINERLRHEGGAGAAVLRTSND